MPFDPVIAYGRLPDYDRREFSELGFLTQTVSFTPEQEVKTKMKHGGGVYNQTGQIQVWRGNLGIEIKGDLVADAQGRVHGLPAGYVGLSVTHCAHFAAAQEGDNPIPALERHGYVRNPAKLLMISSAKTDLGDDAPNCTIGMTYYQDVDKEPIVLAY